MKGADEVNDEQLLDEVSSVQFIKYSQALASYNQRLIIQDGTFAICGNCIENGIITNKIRQINTNESLVAIQIPYQFKIAIKDELDLLFGINDSYIFPELASWSEYIRKKYKSSSFNVQDAYSLLDFTDLSISGIKRLEVVFVLNQALHINDIKKCVSDGIEKYKQEYDVIWFSVATDGECYSVANWALSGQWISPQTNEIYSKFPLYLNDKDGMCWEPNPYFREKNIYDRAYRYKDGKDLLILYQSMLNMLFPKYQTLESAYNILEYDMFVDLVHSHTYFIRELCRTMYSFGTTTNAKLHDFLVNYQDIVINLANITYWVNLSCTPENWLGYRLSDCFYAIRKALSRIEKGRQEWLTFYGIETKEINDIEWLDRKFQELHHFPQNIPISEKAIDVFFKPKITIKQKRLLIDCTTNLYNYAKLLLVLSLDGGNSLSNQIVQVMNGTFSALIDYDITQFRKYIICLSLFIPTNEPSEFVNCAGKEYENITGKWVSHVGVASTLNYVCYIAVDGDEIKVRERNFEFG